MHCIFANAGAPYLFSPPITLWVRDWYHHTEADAVVVAFGLTFALSWLS